MTQAHGGYDPESVRSKYLAERDKRLILGRADIRDLDGDDLFGRYREDPFTPLTQRDALQDDVDVCILGGGIAGITLGAELRKAGVKNIRFVDTAGGFGGTWYWNRYPGVMCDVESYIYLPLLEETGYVPKRRYAFGDEILEYLQLLAVQFDLNRDALFHTRINRALWNEGDKRWMIETDRGDKFTARYYVIAPGILNLLKLPAIPGMPDFKGHSFHSARWDYEYTGGAPGEQLTNLKDKVVGLIGTGATGIQCVPPLAEASKHLWIFQRTPSAIGVRGNKQTDDTFAKSLKPGWQQERMDNFQALMLGREVGADLTDDGWTHDYAKVQNPPSRQPGESSADWFTRWEAIDYEIMEAHRSRVESIVGDSAVAEVLKPWYRYLCKRPCFHDEYLTSFNQRNVTLVDCPTGIDRLVADGVMVNGEKIELDCIVYATGFEAEATPLFRRAGHDIVGVDGVTLAELWADGASSLYGMMVRGLPNLFTMPAPSQQSVVTVNYTQLAVLGAEIVAQTIAQLLKKGGPAFEVTAEAEHDWNQKILASFADASALMSACTPSRINNEGHPESRNPLNGNYGRGFGDYFGYRDLLKTWVASEQFDGLELR